MALEHDARPPDAEKTLKILRHAVSKTYYYLGYRQPIGFDASVASYPNVANALPGLRLDPTSIWGR
jgi:hypothetical protein